MFVRQDIFDRALAHLRTQRQPALNHYQDHDESPRCLYRTPEGLKCAIGALIPDENYNPDLENTAASSHCVIEAMGYNPGDLTQDDRVFLSALQSDLHDEPACALSEDFTVLVEDAAVVFAETWSLSHA